MRSVFLRKTKKQHMNRAGKRAVRIATGVAVATAMCIAPLSAYAAETDSSITSITVPGGPGGMMGGFDSGNSGSFDNSMNGFNNNTGFGGMNNNVVLADEPSEIVESTVENTASALVADTKNATTIEMSDENSQVKITESGTYIVTGSCTDGNITVKKGTTGVVLILKDLTLTSTTGATVSLNKGSEVKLIIEGTVNLTDAEDPADEESEDAEVADAFDGAAIKAKDGSNVYLTGTGTLNIDGSSCKNGIKVGDADYPSFVVDGNLTINIKAANDAFNAGYDLTILSGTINITATDDAIHADRILTIGSSDGTGPVITIQSCEEGIEGTVVNLFGGSATVNSSDDGVNAANSDGTYNEELAFSINVCGGKWTVKAGGDGLDSNGNINITGGSLNITSGNTGGENGIDYDGTCYISDDADLVNNSGISGPDGGAGGNTGGGEDGFTGGKSDGFADDGSGFFSGENGSEDTENGSAGNNFGFADSGAVGFGWGRDTYSMFWYEDGIRQGTGTDEKCFSYDGTLRGREIYDVKSDAWYWLDVNADGAKATGKEVFMPYIYQEESTWSESDMVSNAEASDDGLEEYVLECLKEHTGKWVRYDENGRMLKGWVTIEGTLAELYPDQAGNTYYYDTKTGLMAKGDVTIDGVSYHFDEITGVLQ